MARYAVFLRGINLGKARRVAMADLRTVLTQSGYENVATLLQSGNVVLDADQPADELGRTIEQLIEKRFGLAVDTILRSHDQMTRIVAKNPSPTWRPTARSTSWRSWRSLRKRPSAPCWMALTSATTATSSTTRRCTSGAQAACATAR
ncbi:DUF1697 domain-containing protein [Phytohabitans flavus]|uniref:DUF1697 domain-containing protein n=1 Tax=Phytohabitans flavus TaxID=1076124 RepID=UPI00363FD442